MGALVLGIETSCDDTSVALVDQNGQIAAIKTVSQYEVHSEFGGVYPELASRAHLEAILPTIETVMAQAGAGRLDLRAMGVTRGPGLMGSLLVAWMKWGKSLRYILPTPSLFGFAAAPI